MAKKSSTSVGTKDMKFLTVVVMIKPNEINDKIFYCIDVVKPF